MNTTKKYLFSKGIDSYLEGVHSGYRFTARFFRQAFTLPFHWREIINQCFEIGLKSLSLITLTGFIVGVVFTITWSIMGIPGALVLGVVAGLFNLILVLKQLMRNEPDPPAGPAA